MTARLERVCYSLGGIMKTAVRFFLLAILPAFMLGCNNDSGSGEAGGGTPPPRPPGGTSIPPTAVTLGNLTRAQDASGHIRIMGSVTSSAATPVNFVQVKCTFKDAAGATLGTDQTYIVGSVVRMTSTGAFTNTALNPGDVGYFDVLSTRSDAAIATYTCAATFSTAASTPPAAKLELVGIPNVTANLNGQTLIEGTVKNSGTSPLVFGEVFSVVFDRSNGALLDIHSRFITGRTTTLPTGGTTATALDVNEEGQFTLNTFARYTSTGDIKYLFDWSDSDTLSAALTLGELADVSEASMTYVEQHEQRNRRIEELQKQ